MSLEQKIVVLNRDAWNHARSVAPELLIDETTSVVVVPLRPGQVDDELLEVGDALQPGALLVRNRWAGGWIHAEQAYEALSVAKFNLFAEVCQRLGASCLEVTEIRQVDSDGRATATVALHGGALKGSAGTGGTWLNHMAQSVRGRWEWRGHGANVRAAEEFARRRGILADPMVAMLVSQRGYQENNLGSHRLELDISSEARRTVLAAASLMPSLQKLNLGRADGGFAWEQRELERIMLSVEVTFA